MVESAIFLGQTVEGKITVLDASVLPSILAINVYQLK